jgi:hypothetical protein
MLKGVDEQPIRPTWLELVSSGVQESMAIALSGQKRRRQIDQSGFQKVLALRFLHPRWSPDYETLTQPE